MKQSPDGSSSVFLLEDIWLPTKLAIIYWPGHLKHKSPQAQGNNHEDQVAKEAAIGEPKSQTALELSVVPEPTICLDEDVSEYNPEEIKSCSDLEAQDSRNG
ncbi:hypothetical protein HispidOSU_028717 [Sigmodon hispidus]